MLAKLLLVIEVFELVLMLFDKIEFSRFSEIFNWFIIIIICMANAFGPPWFNEGSVVGRPYKLVL